MYTDQDNIKVISKLSPNMFTIYVSHPPIDHSMDIHICHVFLSPLNLHFPPPPPCMLEYLTFKTTNFVSLFEYLDKEYQ